MRRSTGKLGRVADASAFTVRRAESDDVREIRAIDAQVYSAPWSEKLTLQEITGANRMHFVIEDSGTIVGHAGLAILDGDAHVTTIAVDPGHQRRGIGGRLLDQLFAAARATGCRALTLEVRVSNAGAIAMYEKHGMESAGIRPGYYGDTGEDAVIMWSPQL